MRLLECKIREQAGNREKIKDISDAPRAGDSLEGHKGARAAGFGVAVRDHHDCQVCCTGVADKMVQLARKNGFISKDGCLRRQWEPEGDGEEGREGSIDVAGKGNRRRNLASGSRS